MAGVWIGAAGMKHAKGFHLRDVRQEEDAKQWLSECIAEYGPGIRIHIEKPRNLQQNSLIHIWCRDLAKCWTKQQGTTITEETAKKMVKLHLGLRVSEFDPFEGRDRPCLKPFRDYSQEEMSELLVKVEVFAADQGFVLSPVPANDSYNQYREARL